MHTVKVSRLAAAGNAEAFSALPRTEGAKHPPTFTNDQASFSDLSLAFITYRPPVSYADSPQRILAAVTVLYQSLQCTDLNSVKELIAIRYIYLL